MDLIIRNAKLRSKEGLWDIGIEKGKIKALANNLSEKAEQEIDAEGKLTVPSFIDPHIHLDKVNIVDVVKPNKTGTLKEAIEIIWDKKSKYTIEDIVDRAGDVIKRAALNGTTSMRTHVDIDTIGGLKPLEGVIAAKDKYKDIMDIQTIAFPQEGIIKDPGCDKLMWEAMEMGADIVGGMPANENTPEDSKRHIELCFDIAEKYDADVDMHVDETDDPFYRTLEMLADETIKRGWQGRVTAGHTCALAAYDDHYAKYVIDKVKNAGIHVITNPVTNLMLQGRNDKQPIRRGITRVKELLEAGVNVSFGQDCVKDTFYPFGSADMLQIALITAHAAQMSLPHEIEKVFDMITYDAAKILRLQSYGLEEGKDADIVILDAFTTNDAIRLQPTRLYVIKGGRIIAKSESQKELYFK
ncbi:amidohydrolase family protein [Proteiniborus sp. MB09-C3]|uniref:amidohydrolase family protein n=1 Tax=Proteiniborus sp. MB09-C3 TaxID=3050072 RepID=UPI002556CD94|nr:amidohydrolase family protein [Proteiniborus sp. MB09-C3]WIV12084.1 amidohydrolase family protein [Proteiniborus sp. MB09-C3]